MQINMATVLFMTNSQECDVWRNRYLHSLSDKILWSIVLKASEITEKTSQEILLFSRDLISSQLKIMLCVLSFYQT